MLNTALLMGVLIGIFLVIGFVLGGTMGMTIAFVLALIINFISYWFSDRLVLGMYKAKPSQNGKLIDMVAGVAKEAKIPAPKLYEIDSKIPNAFATGRSPRHAAVAITTGLLELDQDEIEAVVAHEMGHIRNHDILVSSIAATIGGAIVFLAQMGYYSMFSSNERNNQNIIGLLLIVIFAPIAVLLVRMAISRKREFLADNTSALLTHKPKSLANALRKISNLAEKNPLRGNTATENMWIVNPFHKDWFTNMFSTHPPIQQRIERLEEMSGE